MLFFLVLAAFVAATVVPSFDYDNDKVRGVNLGGWFILEPYMNPSMFEIFSSDAEMPIDEYTYCERLGKKEASIILNDHWNTWITEQDFKDLREWGINTVRIGVGYWAYLAREQDPYVQGQAPYVERALSWARQHNIRVWIDLHGVPGSQNGFDNSGHMYVLDWQSDEYPENIRDTYTVLDTLASLYGGEAWSDVVSGIELVNEPNSATFTGGPTLDLGKLHDYYNNGYEVVRKYGPNGVVVHDAFQPMGFFNDWLQIPDYWNVVVDHHHYQVFSEGELQRSFAEQLQVACDMGRQYRSENLWHVCGEWSAALTDCTQWLHGVGTSARYDGSWNTTSSEGSCEGINDIGTWSEERKQNTRRYIEAQLDGFERGSGWIFWSYKTERTLEWDFRRLVQNKLFPQPLTDRQYPNQCGFLD